MKRCLELIIRPQKVMRELLADQRRIAYGFFGTLILSTTYIIGISISLATDSAHLPEYLVLNIPARQYYAYERIFILPVAIGGVILAAGAIRLAARWWGGQGCFEDHFALLGFSLIAIALVMGLPDLVLAMLVGLDLIPSPGWTFVGPHVWLGTLWYFALMAIAVRQTEHLSWGKTLALVILGFTANGAVQFVFIR